MGGRSHLRIRDWGEEVMRPGRDHIGTTPKSTTNEEIDKRSLGRWTKIRYWIGCWYMSHHTNDS